MTFVGTLTSCMTNCIDIWATQSSSDMEALQSIIHRLLYSYSSPSLFQKSSRRKRIELRRSIDPCSLLDNHKLLSIGGKSRLDASQKCTKIFQVTNSWAGKLLHILHPHTVHWSSATVALSKLFSEWKFPKISEVQIHSLLELTTKHLGN